MVSCFQHSLNYAFGIFGEGYDCFRFFLFGGRGGDENFIQNFGGVRKYFRKYRGGTKIFWENLGGYENFSGTSKKSSHPLPPIKSAHPLFVITTIHKIALYIQMSYLPSGHLFGLHETILVAFPEHTFPPFLGAG